MQKTLTKKRIGYLMATMLFALTISATSTYAWFDFIIFNKGSAIAIIVILGLIAAAVVYAKFFRGSATKLFSKIKRSK